jgi:hypothetical protein
MRQAVGAEVSDATAACIDSYDTLAGCQFSACRQCYPTFTSDADTESFFSCLTEANQSPSFCLVSQLHVNGCVDVLRDAGGGACLAALSGFSGASFGDAVKVATQLIYGMCGNKT